MNKHVLVSASTTIRVFFHRNVPHEGKIVALGYGVITMNT